MLRNEEVTRQIGRGKASLAEAALFFLVMLFLGFRPIWKFYESHRMVPHLNVSAVLAVGLSLVACLIIAGRRGPLRRRSQVWGFVLLLWVIGIQVASFPWASRYTANGLYVYLSVIADTIVAASLVWLWGTRYDTLLALLDESTGWRVALHMVFLVFAGTIIYGVSMQPVPLSLHGLRMVVGEDGDYLMISDAFAFLSLLEVYAARSTMTRGMLSVLSLVLLYACSSRSAFYGYSVALLALLARDWRRLGLLLVATITAASVYTFVVPMELRHQVTEGLAQSRILRLLVDPGADWSFNRRLELLESGWNVLKQNWLLGLFMGEVAVTGRTGTYMHNWLSFWSAYGLFPFVAYCGIFFAAIVTALRRWLQGDPDRRLSFAIGAMFFVLFSITFSRAYVWPYAWFPIGVGAAGGQAVASACRGLSTGGSELRRGPLHWRFYVAK